jgi:hypothetical protein
MALVGDFYRITHVTTTNAQVGLMVSHWRVGSIVAPGPTDQEFADGFSTLMAAAIKALMSNAAVYKGCIAQKVFPLPVLARATGVTLAGAGGVVGTEAPTQTCGLITLRTAVAGRSGRGRKYIPFPSVADINSTGDPSTSYGTRLATLMNLLINGQSIPGALGNANVAPCIWHRANPALSNLVTTGLVRSSFATQRRRGALGRPNLSPI